MVFGLKKLQDDLFCITEERNYFQGKYTEQVSEIAALKEELRKARREILKLRGELMESSTASLLMDDESEAFQTPPKNNRRRSRRSLGEDGHQEEKKDPDNVQSDDDSSNPRQSAEEDPSETVDEDEQDEDEQDDHNEDEDCENDDEDTEAADIRQSAEKLLQWASYRSYARTSSASASNSPDQGSVASGQAQTLLQEESTSLLGPMIPRQIEASLENSMSEDTARARNNNTP